MSPSLRHPRHTHPSKLKINDESHSIRKPLSSATSDTSSTTNHANHPIIIYTSPPKVIHTEACDFMALVQKLTGLSRSNDTDITDTCEEEEEATNVNLQHEPPLPPSSDLRFEENCTVNGDVVQVTCSSISSNSLSPSDQSVSPPVANMNATTLMEIEPADCLDLLCPEMISPSGWIHTNFDYEDNEEFF